MDTSSESSISESCDIVVVCALFEELEEVVARLPSTTTREQHNASERWCRINVQDRSLTLCAISRDAQGEEDMQDLTASAIRAYKPQLVVLIGISGAISDDLALGDVVVATSADRYMFRSKFTEAGERKGSKGGLLKTAGENLRAERDAWTVAKLYPQLHSDQFDDWKRVAITTAAGYFQHGSVAPPKSAPKMHVGPVASGPSVIANKEMRDLLKSRNRVCHAVDMESGGFLLAVENVPRKERPAAMILRGISDKADTDKNVLERDTKGAYRKWSMHNASTLFKRLLPGLLEMIANDVHHEHPRDYSVALRARIRLVSVQPHLVVPDDHMAGQLDRANQCLARAMPVLPPDMSCSDALITAIDSLEGTECLAVVGEAGTGKSAAASLLYETLWQRYAAHSATYLPVLVDLHKYSRPDGEWASDESARQLETRLGSDLELINKARETSGCAGIVFIIDGLDSEMPWCKYFAAMIESHVRPGDKVAITSRNVSITSYSGRRIHNRRYMLLPIGCRNSELAELCRSLLPSTVPEEESLVIAARAADALRASSFAYLDLWTVAQVSTRAAEHVTVRLSDALGTYCDTRLATQAQSNTLKQAAKDAYLQYCHEQVLQERPLDNYSLEFQFLFAHPVLQSFLICHHVLENVLNAAQKQGEEKEVLARPYPVSVNILMKEMLELSSKYQVIVLDRLQSEADRKSKNNVNAPVHIYYLAGRLSGNARKKTAITNLRKVLNKLEQIRSDSSHHDRLVRRTLYISLAYLGDKQAASEYIDMLMRDHREDEVNRGFHLEYYGDLSYRIAEPMVSEDPLGQFPRTFGRLAGRIQKSDSYPLYPVEVYTLFSLAQHRHAGLRLNDTTRREVIEISRVVLDRTVLSPRLRDYVSMVADHLGTDRFSVQTLVEQFMRVKSEKRRGWLKYGHHDTESVADHMYGCILIASMLLSPSRLNGVECDIDRIVKMLLIHDLGEAVTGDLLPEEKGEPADVREMSVFRQLSMFGSYHGIRDMTWIRELFNEFKAGATVESRIARDIDKLENLLQMYLYHKAGIVPTEDVGKWKSSLRGQISTDVGAEIAKLIVSTYEQEPWRDEPPRLQAALSQAR